MTIHHNSYQSNAASDIPEDVYLNHPARQTSRLSLDLITQLSDILLAIAALIPGVVIMGVLFLPYKVFNRNTGSFIYTGDRLGKNKTIFRIYKIRTLSEKAENAFSSGLFTQGTGLELKFGKMLRKTRLDELPQLFNILKGDMAFIGPRPVRESIYKKFGTDINGYDIRFTVKPGLLGVSQLITPHSSPKRIRARLDSIFIKKKRDVFTDSLFLIWALSKLLKNLISECANLVGESIYMMIYQGQKLSRRKTRRLSGKGVTLLMTDPSLNEVSESIIRIVDINHEAILIESTSSFQPGNKVSFTLHTNSVKKRGVYRGHQARCTGILSDNKNHIRTLEKGNKQFVIFWAGTSDYSRYIIDHYILRQSIIK